LADADEIAVNEAGSRDDLPAIYKVIFAAIAYAPEQAAAIADEAVRLAPNHRDAIINTASATFPEYAGQFAAAGGEAAAEEENSPWSGEAGPGFRQACERSQDGGSVSNDLVGWAATDLAWQITEDTKFINNFGGTGNSKRVQLDNTTALTLKIVDNFAARLSYEVRHDTDPGDDAGKTDTAAKASLVYGFGGGGN
jgi:hypothetical protein